MELSMIEMLVICVVALILYGGDLPQLARQVGRWIAKIRRIYDDLQYEVRKQVDQVTSEVQIPELQELNAPADAVGAAPYPGTTAGLPAPDAGSTGTGGPPATSDLTPAGPPQIGRAHV